MAQQHGDVETGFRPRWRSVLRRLGAAALAGACLAGVTVVTAQVAPAQAAPSGTEVLRLDDVGSGIVLSAASGARAMRERVNPRLTRQYWRLVWIGPGTTMIQNAATGTCLAALTPAAPGNYQIAMRPCDRSLATQWGVGVGSEGGQSGIYRSWRQFSSMAQPWGFYTFDW